MIKFLRGTNTSDATATETDIRVGKTAYNGTGKVEGQLDFTGFDDYNRCNEVVDEILNGTETIGITELNLFVQEEEPVKKQGIWLQTNKSYEHIFSEKDVFAGEMWDTVNTISPINSSEYNWLAEILGYIDGYLYFDVYGKDSKHYLGKYDMLTKKLTILAQFPSNMYTSGVKYAVVVKSELYVLNFYNSYVYIYKYNKVEDTFIEIYKMSSDAVIGITTDGERYIYYISYNYSYSSSYINRYDIITNDKDILYSGTNVNLSNSYRITYANEKLYFINASTSIKHWVYDINAAQLNQLNINFSSDIASKIANIICINQSIIYLFLQDKSNYKYDIIQNELTRISDDTTASARSSETTSVTDGKNIYIRNISNSYKPSILSLQLKDYPDKSIVISQGGYDKSTVLLKNSTIEGNILQYFRNAWYYTTEGNVDMTIPTYYGDGTKWIQFK